MMKNEKGFSYIELMITIMFFAAVVGPLAWMVGQTMVSGEDDRNSYIATVIARGLLEEIQGAAFEDETGNPWGNEESASVCNRSVFDDIDDYDVFQTWGGCTPPTDRSGSPIPGADDFSETVSVVNLVDIALAPDNIRTNWSTQPDGTTDTKQIIVTVSWPGGSYTLTMLLERP